ncbi:MAG TPA: sugar phosphate isomerase/epimerase [Candidatus Sulfotelmatobacter sp.]|nr:sugar phosphate isomerase/epimerase [Candidatus Sulfotelmatobacter sp.]
MMDRRTFLGTLTGAAATAMMSRSRAWAADEHRIKTIGIQLYTVRDALKRDYDGTLAELVKIGYREVESGKDHDLPDPKAMRAALDRAGLTSPSFHVGWDGLGADWPKIIEANKIVGRKYLVNPWVDEEVRDKPDGWKHAAETLNHAGEIAKKSDIQFAYHNHWIEFVPLADGKLPYDILLENLDPNLVKMEMDLGWATVGGQDPVKYFQRYPGRFPLVHVKDLHEVPDAASVRSSRFAGEHMTILADVGTGVIDWKRIFAHSEQAGIKHYFVEHDNPKDGLQTARVSYAYLEKLRF